MEIIDPLDAAFLLAESREHPMHVGALMLFEPPADAGPEYVREVYDQIVENTNYHPTFLKRLATPRGSLGGLFWDHDTELDVEYHIRRVHMPTPGRIRELLSVVSRWHGTLLDRHKPLWEAHIIEGLADGRFAIYVKVHHALLDGMSAQRLIQRRLTSDPEDRNCVPPWNRPEKPRGRKRESSGFDAVGLLRAGGQAVADVAGVIPDAVKVARQAFSDNDLILPYRAPQTILNVPIGGARRFAAQSWDFDRINAVKKSAGVSVNDVVLAMCGGALRNYLIDNNALPDSSMSAFVPISTRAADKMDAGGNAVGAIIASLGTNTADSVERLDAVNASMKSAKSMFKSIGGLSGLAWSGAAVSPMVLAGLPLIGRVTPHSFNVIISNVPGPRDEQYFNGARLDGIYPVSVVTDGQALNITLTNTAGTLDFGLIGCRRSLPSLQRILTHLETELSELEKAFV
jgi:diacylglycerol O-acyltransferase / wax synthase